MQHDQPKKRQPTGRELYLMRLARVKTLEELDRVLNQPESSEADLRFIPPDEDYLIGAVEDREVDIYLYQEKIEELKDKKREGYEEETEYLEKEIDSSRREINRLLNEEYPRVMAEQYRDDVARDARLPFWRQAMGWLKERKLQVVWGVAIALMGIRLLYPPVRWVGVRAGPSMYPNVYAPDWIGAFAHCVVIALIAAFFTWLIKTKT